MNGTDDEEFKKARSTLELFYLTKDRKALIEISQNSKIHPYVRDYASGLLMRPWLPWGVPRKLIMFLLTGLIIFLAILFQNLSVLLCLVLPLLFSPRVIGEIAMFIGRLSHDRK